MIPENLETKKNGIQKIFRKFRIHKIQKSKKKIESRKFIKAKKLESRKFRK